jgi:hypothetical protein
MAEKISHVWREMKPYVIKETDKTMQRRGLTPPATASTTAASAPGVWTFDDGSLLDDGLVFDPS